MKVAGKLFEQLPGLQIDLTDRPTCIRKEAKMQRCACAQNLGRLAGFPSLARGPPEQIVGLCVVWIGHSVCKVNYKAREGRGTKVPKIKPLEVLLINGPLIAA